MSLKKGVLVLAFAAGVLTTVAIGLVVSVATSIRGPLVVLPSDVSILQAKAAGILGQTSWSLHCDNSDYALVLENDHVAAPIDSVRLHLRSDGWKDSGEGQPDRWSQGKLRAVFDESGKTVKNFRLYLMDSDSC